MNKSIAFSAVALVAIFTSLPGVAFAADSASAQPAAAPMTATTAAGEISKDQAVAMALEAHPGDVIKAYQDSKKGKKTWEVKIKGADGKKWELHYEIKTGALVSEEGR